MFSTPPGDLYATIAVVYRIGVYRKPNKTREERHAYRPTVFFLLHAIILPQPIQSVFFFKEFIKIIIILPSFGLLYAINLVACFSTL